MIIYIYHKAAYIIIIIIKSSKLLHIDIYIETQPYNKKQNYCSFIFSQLIFLLNSVIKINKKSCVNI